MIEQWAKIDPDSSFFQCYSNCINIVKYVVCCIKEEACSDALKGLWSLIVYWGELSSTYTKIHIVCQCWSRGNFRYFNAPKDIFLIVVIRGRMYEWVYLKLFLLFRAINNKVWTKKHEICKLIALSSKSCIDKLED